ncbi:serine hydrolase domain-containing protein [Clostridium ihumii]|uniref:serine hydrolase domain-containing protein n=1 Tax=Clostridium ihumii TaxID=1470356 RepID=UPI00058E62C1|nr:serine hydrolase domain-containing protein [Clostridium ihumii]
MKQRLRKSVLILLCSITFCLYISIPTLALSNDMEINHENIEYFMDDFFKKNIDKYNLPGAAVVVVKDGEEILKKGYGYSNLDEKKVINPDETLFPAASVSKLFTATAIMQLAEQGKIDLNENVEKYIAPYKIENKFVGKVTCRNLLTHTSGVDEASEINGNTRDKNNIKSQEYYFDNHKIIVTREPDTVSRYSNQGYNILGYIIEKVSGMSYEQYINDNILYPLKMNNSLVRLDNDNLAKGYEISYKSYTLVPLAYQYTSGSSGIVATVKDMENFMLAHLNNGEFQGNRIMNVETSKLMQSKQFANDNIFSGMGYGFIRSNRNGQEIIKHEGALPGYTTTMFLIPKQNLGVYVATNSLNPVPFNIEEDFLDEFYTENINEYKDIIPKNYKDYSKYSGIYRNYDGISKSNIMKIGYLFDPTMDMEIVDNKDGTLSLKEYTNAKEKNVTKLVETDDGVFAREDGKGKFAFRLDEKGQVIYAFNDVSHNAYEKINLYQGRELNIVLLAFSTVIFLIVISRSLFRCVKRLVKKQENEDFKEIKRLNICNCIISFLSIMGFYGSVILAVSIILINDSSFISLLYILLGCIVVATILSIMSIIYTIGILAKCNVKVKVKLFYVIVSIANLVFGLEMYHFNFLGFKI